MAEEEAVQVAVRMRVFNKRETAANATRIIRMEAMDKGSRTYIKNTETGEEKKFEYDYSFQSHSTTEPGIGEWADQETVFRDLGRPVMESSLEGRNVCLFAYGQTGAGKSFSMLGNAENPGIIPRTCNAIFDMVDNETDPNLEYVVDIQVVEIYCEIINDLLADRKQWPQHGHKPRLTDRGYVVDTIRRPCFKYADIESAFKFADQNRSVGSHALNPESSRAHTIYTINYERKKKNAAGKVCETITARLNLVDLAGSERTDSAGTSGQMLKEGNAINLSLTALGSCIKSLSEGKRPNFRDSKLTLLLQGSMTNGKVVMIAALSPASICHDESMSTLRFADRIKKVKIKASKNVTADPVAEMKKAMEEMRETMQHEIESLRTKASGTADPKVLEELQERLRLQNEETDQLKEELENKLKAMEETDEDRQEQAANIELMQQLALGGATLLSKDDVKDPMFLNLTEDPRLAETLVYPFKEGDNVIGRPNKEKEPDISFNGMGIVKNHCTVNWTGDKVTITPGPKSRTLVNGNQIDGPTELFHNNRVWLGNNYAFRFAFPGQEEKGDKFEEPVDYLMAEAEITENAEKGSEFSNMPKGLNGKLSEALKKVEQANVIAMDMRKPMEFEAKLFKSRISKENEIYIKVNCTQGELYWPWEKFKDRLVLMSQEYQAWQTCEESGQTYEAPKNDPYVDNEDQLLGEADIWCQALANMIEHKANPSLLAVTGKVEGRIRIEIQPCDRNGKEGPWDDDEENDPYVDDPQDLIGESIQFVVKIKDIIFDANIGGASGSSCKYTDTWVRYKLNMQDEDEEWSKTAEVNDVTFNPKYDYSKRHTITVDQSVLNMLHNRCLVFQLWGKLSQNVEGAAGGGKRNRGILAKLDAEIKEKHKIVEDLQKQIEERRRQLEASG